MGDSLERFIIKNRKEFDSEIPSDKLWSQIDQKLEKRKPNLSIIWKIAAMLFLGSTIYLAQEKITTYNEPTLSSEFQEAESYYTHMINLKMINLKEQMSPELQQEFLADINELDSIYDGLKMTLIENTTNQRIIDAMINNLQLRLELLNKQIEILNNYNKEDYENEYVQI